jgi:hypothetical protein
MGGGRSDFVARLATGVLLVSWLTGPARADDPKPPAPAEKKPADAPPPAAKKPKKEPPPVFTDPEKAGDDYKIQGEYEGVLKTAADEKFAAQVVAAGNGRFDVIFFRGGFPGAGWNGKDRVKVPAETADGKVVLKPGPYKEGKETREAPAVSGTIEGGKLAGKWLEGYAFELTRTVRKSPTEGAKPPEGAIVLFDGSNADEWVNGKVVDAPDGTKCLFRGTQSKRKFTDFKLHVEFRTVFSPQTPAGNRSNSGVFLDEFYEVQILDSFGAVPEKHNCGAMYTFRPATVNACFPPLQWQTYDIDFTAAKFDSDGKKISNARVTVLHNGVKIHDDQEYPAGTNGRPDAKKAAPILLQDHGSPVMFRNIWIVEKK